MTITTRATLLSFAAGMLMFTADIALAEELKVGNHYRGSVELSKGMGGIILPLPDSDWQMVSLKDSRAAGVDYNLPTTNGGCLALPLDKPTQQIKSFISYWAASTDPMHGGWKEPDVCGSAAAYYSYRSKDNRRLTRVQCWTIKLESVTAGKYMPPLMVGVTYFWSAGAKALHVTYHFNPATAGFPPLTAEGWSVAAVAAEPKQAKYLDDLKTWAAAWQPKVDQGFSGKRVP
jgi:hypothetical protein